MKELEAIKGRLSAITPGPWELAGGNEWLSPLGIDVGHEDESARPTLAYRDAEFIAHAPETQAKLIAALEAVGELSKRVSQQAVDKYNKARVLPPDERAVAAAAAVEFEVIAADLHQAISEALA